MSLERRSEPLRRIAEQLQQDSLRQILVRPGVNEAVRVTMQYGDGRVPDSVATLWRGLGDACQLKVVYNYYGSDGQPYTYTFAVSPERYQRLLGLLRQSRFDRLDDEEELPLLGVDLCLVERGSGAFYHDVVFSPQSALGHLREIWLGLNQYLPEAVRELSGKG